LMATRTLARLSAFLRSFAIQGSWNYRTMLGGGFAFAMLPVLRRLYRDDPGAFAEALHRHAEHFNAHPYLADLALGAACRMEEDGVDPEEIRRFKLAVRGPLGGLGDSVVWMGWRPAIVLAAVALAMAGASPAVTVVFFLVAYNVGHLCLRGWGFGVGLAQGSEIGGALRHLALPRQADRLEAAAIFLLGGVAGLALDRSMSLGGWPLMVLAGAGGVWGFWLGSLIGHKGWRWTLSLVACAIGLILFFGWLA
jgi:PTS system mannose-specific IID component